MLAFLLFSGSPVISQGLGGPGAGGDPEDRWICCQVNFESYCTDMDGNGWNRDVKKYQRTC